jgi:hypothetical protein
VKLRWTNPGPRLALTPALFSVSGLRFGGFDHGDKLDILP